MVSARQGARVKILCSGYLVRYPLGGHSFHHLQYLVGLAGLGHQVTYFEHFGWEDSCYDPSRDVMTQEPAYGTAFLRQLMRAHRLPERWCYLAQDGTAHGMSREQLGDECADCDLYLSLSNINWSPELERCRRRVLIDTDPVFTQLGAHGVGGPLERYARLFTYGENVHRPGCEMPTAGARWLPTRQPVLLDLWAAQAGCPTRPLTSVLSWSPFDEVEHGGRVYGQRDREFEPFFSFPRETGQPMEVAANAPETVLQRLTAGGWCLVDPLEVTGTPAAYQGYLGTSRGEFSVAKHAYVTTRCGWFSDRTAGYLASGRPAVTQDTGFSAWLPCGEGLLPYRSKTEAVAAIRGLFGDYEAHCRAARGLVEAWFDARRVLTELLERSF
jgi:hypothetical protein